MYVFRCRQNFFILIAWYGFKRSFDVPLLKDDFVGMKRNEIRNCKFDDKKPHLSNRFSSKSGQKYLFLMTNIEKSTYW